MKPIAYLPLAVIVGLVCLFSSAPLDAAPANQPVALAAGETVATWNLTPQSPSDNIISNHVGSANYSFKNNGPNAVDITITDFYGEILEVLRINSGQTKLIGVCSGEYVDVDLVGSTGTSTGTVTST